MTSVVINCNGAGYGHVLVDGVALAGVGAVSVQIRAGSMPVVSVELVPTELILQLPDVQLATSRQRLEDLDQTPRCDHGVPTDRDCTDCAERGRKEGGG